MVLLFFMLINQALFQLYFSIRYCILPLMVNYKIKNK